MVFWDFDGVIKESVSTKTEAFIELFQKYGQKVAERVKNHHIYNGGMSRYDKVPLYLKWSGIEPTSFNIKKNCDEFSKIVKKKVINSNWVPGVEEFLRLNKDKYIFVMISATPTSELEEICKTLNIYEYFAKIYGSPIKKAIAIRNCIKHFNIPENKCLFFGDAKADIDAANETKINFIFRRHDHNKILKINSNINVINDFN